MAAVLGMYLKHHDVICESAGTSEYAARGGPAAEFATKAAQQIGLDISRHERRQVTNINLSGYDLIVCVNDEIGGEMYNAGVEPKKIWNAQIVNPWPVHFEQDYEPTMQSILGAMYKVVARYF